MQPAPPILDVIPDARLGVAASAVCFRDSSRRRWLSFGEAVVFGLILFLGSLAVLGENGLYGAYAGYCLSLLWLCVIRAGRMRKRLAMIWTSPPYRLSIDEEGLSATSEGGSLWRSWNRVSKLVERPEWVTIVYDGLESLTIPDSAFGNKEARESWLRYVSTHARVIRE